MKSYQYLLIVMATLLVTACDQQVADKAQTVDSTVESETAISEPATDTTQPQLPQPKTEPSLLDCQPMEGITSYCGFRNPEDLIMLSDTKTVLVSEMGEFMLDTPGTLSLLDLASGERLPLSINWPDQTSADTTIGNWGDSRCPAPDIAAFSPHGIDLTTLSNGKHQLLVVNHGGRESVEFFELSEVGETWQLTWQGCALPPGDPFINDVAGMTNGGFFVTHMWDKKTSFEEVGRKLLSGENTGWVYKWEPSSGFSIVPGSEQMMPNGIAINADNSKLYINIYMASKTIRMDLASGEQDGEFAVQQPDNITIDTNGDLWVASHKQDPLNQTCALVTEGPCLLPYEIIKVDPDTLETTMFLHQDGAPMGYSTVALKVGDRLLMGSAHGDRIAAVAIP